MSQLVALKFEGSARTLLRTLRKRRMAMMDLRRDAGRIQAALDAAARQEATRQALAASTTRGGIA